MKYYWGKYFLRRPLLHHAHLEKNDEPSRGY